jgi:hypothetical protein
MHYTIHITHYTSLCPHKLNTSLTYTHTHTQIHTHAHTACYYYNMPEELSRTLAIANVVFTAVYSIEIGMRMTALGMRVCVCECVCERESVSVCVCVSVCGLHCVLFYIL